MVRTPRGWLGRRALGAALTDNMPVQFGYVFDTPEQAAALAAGFEGAELVPFRDVDL